RAVATARATSPGPQSGTVPSGSSVAGFRISSMSGAMMPRQPSRLRASRFMNHTDTGFSATFDALCRRADSLGLAVRGAFHPEAGEFDELLPAASAGTIVLLGFTGSEQWELFERSAEARDGLQN